MMLACLVLQCSVLPAIAIASVVPNLMIVFTASFGLMRGKRAGLLIGFFSGLLADLMFMVLDFYMVGFRAVIYMFIGYLCGCCCQIFYDEDVKMPVLLTALGDLVYGIAVYGAQFMLRGRIHFFYYLRRIILPEVVYTIVLTLITYRFFLFVHRKLVKSEKRGVDSFV